MTIDAILEIAATLLGLGFLIGVIQRKIWSWPMGTLSSGLSVVLFYRFGLYAETGLYVLYVIMGFYGWWMWSNKGQEGEIQLVDYPWVKQWWSLLGIPAAILLGYFLNQLHGVSFAYFDAFTSTFAIIATWQETRRIRTAFHYWIPLNIATMILYGAKGLWVYAALMLVYSVMSVVGFLNWRK